jgi:hypothetical protein
MNVFGAILAILNVVMILGPVAGVAVIYRDNLQQTVITPQIQDLITASGGNALSGGSMNLFSGQGFALPQFVSATADVAARSVTLVVNFTNPFNYDLVVNSISADVVCVEHNFNLGHGVLIEPTNLPANQTTDFTMVCTWTQAAENHFLTEHTSASSVAAEILGLTANVNGITIQSDQAYPIGDLPISTNIAPPNFVSAAPDLVGRSVSIVFDFTNPFNTTLNLDSVSADIVCSQHGFTLGHASLASPVVIPPDATSRFTIVCQWTADAETHFAAQHTGATSIDVDVTGLTVSENGVTVVAPSTYHVPGVPLTG